MQVIQLLGSAFGLAFLSGINLYAAILTVGLGVRFGILELPGHLAGLQVLTDPIILSLAAVLYMIEFVADKVPWVDTLWDSIHTFIRPIGGAMVGMAAMGGIAPTAEIFAYLILGGIGLSSHSAKASTRLVVNKSPEPVSNSILSVVEDVVVVLGTWFAITNPKTTFVIVLILLVCVLALLPKIVRLIRLEVVALIAILKKVAPFVRGKGAPSTPAKLPTAFIKHLPERAKTDANSIVIKCFTGRGSKIGTHCAGYLCCVGERLILLSKKRFRVRASEVRMDDLKEVKLKQRLLFDNLYLIREDKTVSFHCPKGQLVQLDLVITFINELRLKGL